ncbi:riboflavin synthase [Pontixanthobacter sp.]|uniref:riboflavin synthase n=1 Tax=Pontixanthobacter sp. TaxID=2792078 RepID=UPI003C7E4128
MFTGIVTAIGTIDSSEARGDLRVRVACPFDPETIAIGASIACSGACMTVVERGGAPGDAWFAVDISEESLSKTAPGMWDAGAALNLESALKLGDELGGHIVTGHVDAVGEVESTAEIGGSHTVVIRAPQALAAYIAPKGSITVDGVSLTVNAVTDNPDGSCSFALNIIPHTWEVTTLGSLKQGSHVNLEIDVLARYLQRMESLRG